MKISGGMVVLKNGEQLPVSRSHLQEVKQNDQPVLGGAYMMERLPMISLIFLANEMRLLLGLYLLSQW